MSDNYLKADEVADYVTRVTVTSGKETILARVAKQIVDAYCNRSLYIKHYKTRFDLSQARVGRCPYRPIVSIDPVDTETGLRITALQSNIRGQRQSVSLWTDIVIPDPLDELLNKESGRIELKTFSISGDMGRQWYAYPGALANLVGYQAELEVLSGFFYSGKLTATAANGANTLTVDNTVGLTANQSYVNVGDKKAQYLVTEINGLVLTINPVLSVSSTQAVGTYVTEVAPDNVKCACAMIIEDRLVYEPNTLRQSETLDVLSSRQSRMDASAMPVDAQFLLQDYKML